MMPNLDYLSKWIEEHLSDTEWREALLEELAHCHANNDASKKARAIRNILQALSEKDKASLLLEKEFCDLVTDINALTLKELSRATKITNIKQLIETYPIIIIQNDAKIPVSTIASSAYYEQHLVNNITILTDKLLDFVKANKAPESKEKACVLNNNITGLCSWNTTKSFQMKRSEIKEILPPGLDAVSSIDLMETLITKLVTTINVIGETIEKNIAEQNIKAETIRQTCAPASMEKMLLTNEITAHLKTLALSIEANTDPYKKVTTLIHKIKEATKEYKQKFEAISDVIDVKYKDLVADYKGESKKLFRNTYDRNYIIATRTTMLSAMNKLDTLAKIKYAHAVLTNKALSDFANPAAKSALNAVNYCLALQIINIKDPLSLLSNDQPSRKLWIKIGESYNKKEAALNSETKKQMIEVLKTYIRTCSKSAKDILKNLESDTPTKDPFIDCCVAELQKHRLGRKKGTYGIDTKSYKQILEYVGELAGPKLTNKTEIVATKTVPEAPKAPTPTIMVN